MINYKAEVLNVDTATNLMVVRYTSEGKSTVTTSLGLPYEDQAVENVIKQCAPLSQWMNEGKGRAVVTVGYITTVTADTAAPAAPDINQITNQELMQLAFEKRLSAALVKFGVLTTDPMAIPVTTV